MFEIADRLVAALDEGDQIALVTVSRVLGSAPRTVGTSMALAAGDIVGSISGGCVESAAVDACERVLETGVAETARFGFTDDDAFAVGLSCGGELDVVVSVVRSASVRAELDAAVRGDDAAIATIVDGPAALIGRTLAGWAGRDLDGDLNAEDLAAAALTELTLARLRADVDAWFRAARTGELRIECAAESLTVLVESQRTAPLLLIVGAVEFAAALAAAARPLGFHVTVVDARPAFATPQRFPSAHEVVAEWPHLYLSGLEIDERTVICVLSHDDRFDVPVLKAALDSVAEYIGALGSRRTHERRVEALRDAGVTDDALARLHSPIGLDIGASTPEETAVSILAEVLAARSGGRGRALREIDGPIHRRLTEVTEVTTR